jgi:hypothetical protein
VLKGAAAGRTMTRQLGQISGAGAAGQGSAGATLAASGIAECNLRGLAGPDSTSIKGFDRAPGALATNPAGRPSLTAGVQQLQQGQPLEAALKRPVEAVAWDLLFVGEHGEAANHRACCGRVCFEARLQVMPAARPCL